MKILLENYRVRGGNRDLAKEIGLEESEALLVLEAAIQTLGTRRNGTQMIARTSKQLAEMLGWCGAAHARKLLESLRDRNYVYIDEEDLFDSATAWYGIYWKKIKTLKSVVVMDDDEIEEAHELAVKETRATSANTNGSRAHQALFGAFIKACDFKQELLTPRDRAEIGSSVKKLMGLYAGRAVETEELQRAVLGFRVWWVNEGRRFKVERPAPRPYTVLSNWGKYETATKQSGAMPDVPEEWL